MIVILVGALFLQLGEGNLDRLSTSVMGSLRGDAVEAKPSGETVLYVWAGPRDPEAAPQDQTASPKPHTTDQGTHAQNPGANTGSPNDVLVTIDLQTKRVIHVLDVGSADNEPHHTTICKDHLFASGLHSGSVFIFDLKAPRTPKLVKIIEGKQYDVGHADDIYCLPDDRILISMMSSADGSQSGRVLELGPDFNVRAAHTKQPPEAFNPHGLAVDYAGNRMVTTDFFEAKSIAERAPRFRNTVRVWDLEKFEIIQTVQVGLGPMEIAGIPGDPDGRAVVTNTAEGSLGVVGRDSSGKYVYKTMIDMDGDTNNSVPGGARISKDGKSLWVALYGFGEVRRYDISDPEHPKLLATGRAGIGTHYLRVTPDQKHVYASNYFVQDIEGWFLPYPDLKVWRFDAETMQGEELMNFGADTTDPLLKKYAPLQPHGIEVK